MNSVAAAKSPSVKQGISNMTIEPANGGAISEVHMDRAPTKSMMYTPPPKPVRTVHPSIEHLNAHVAKHFGHLFKKKNTAVKASIPKMKPDTDGDGM